MAEMRDAVTGVVLAGGRSSRFGSNKAFAPWKGKTLAEAAAGSLSRIFAETLVVVKDPSRFRFLEKEGVRLVEDGFEEAHPMGGIWSSLSAARSKYAFILACDMPFLQPRLVSGLWAAVQGYEAAVPVWNGRAQPLCAMYSKDCRGVVECLIKDGRLSVLELFGIIRTRFLLEPEVMEHDPAGKSFVDLDTPEDYQSAIRRLRC